MHIDVHEILAMVVRLKLPFRPDIGQEVAEMLEDFCEAHHEANATEVVRKAVRDFILRDTAMNDGIRAAYQAARVARNRG